MKLIRSVLLALALLTGPPAIAQTVTSTEWKAMLSAAKAGDVLELGAREVQHVRQTLAPDTCCVTIRGGVFKGTVTLDKWRNVVFDGSRFEDTTNQGTYAYLVLAYAPDGLTFRNSEFVGSFFNGRYEVNAIRVDGGRNVTLQRNKIHDGGGFLAFKQTDGVLIEDNDLWNIREGIQLPATQNVIIRRNKIGPFIAYVPNGPGSGDHADGIQVFMNGFKVDDPLVFGTGNVLIEDNLIIANTGLTRRAQCMLIQDEQDFTSRGRPLHDFTIRGNTCLATGWHGISLNHPGMVNALVENNRLIQLDGDAADPIKSNWIVTKPGTNVVVRGNRGPRFMLDASTIANDNTVDAAQPSPADYAKVIADWDARFRATAPAPVPTPTPTPTPSNVVLLERAQKAKLEIQATRNAANRALYAIDQLIDALTASK